MMPTIKDVAEKAGVGIATVSRAMNGTGYVSARSREKIETAIRELHYIPMNVHVICPESRLELSVC